MKSNRLTLAICAAISALAFGCGSEPTLIDGGPNDWGQAETTWTDWQPSDNDDAHQSVVVDEESDLGTESEAFSIPGGYGVTNDSQRCAVGQTVGCKIPVVKSANFIDSTGNCGGPNAALYRQAFTDAYLDWKPILQNRGWTVLLNQPRKTNPPLARTQIDAEVRCGGTGGGLDIFIAGTIPNCMGLPFPHNNNSPCFTYSTTTYLDQAGEIDNILTRSLDPLDRKYFLKGVVQHELGHMLGLGHTPSSECSAIPTVMCNAAGFNTTDPSTWDPRSPTTTEKNWLRDYDASH